MKGKWRHGCKTTSGDDWLGTPGAKVVPKKNMASQPTASKCRATAGACLTDTKGTPHRVSSSGMFIEQGSHCAEKHISNAQHTAWSARPSDSWRWRSRADPPRKRFACGTWRSQAYTVTAFTKRTWGHFSLLSTRSLILRYIRLFLHSNTVTENSPR
jgi:hypothetical protein